ncbi:DUF4434 family protein [Pseudomonas nabeulensis]|uniref:DUF4434 family protein n=1 Tax=Pseudomonas nabeulensis TaxID=2293833 RepID=A0A4Z0B1S4_9PSED|nr:DUF4434 family protein [Pseudomonas nabeulensis]TFY93022.1 DUF4434 family protein [Pseudomonas nabeulensis]
MKRLMLVVCLLMVAVQAAFAGPRVFYQPLDSDAAITARQWQQVWQATANSGADTVIVQWTAYGDGAQFGGAQGWLANSLREAHAQGLKLVLGLYMDPAYYQRIQELDSAGLAAYWRAQLGRSLAQQQRVRDEWKLPVTGWYVPMELDDLHFLAIDRRTELQRQLVDLSKKLDAPLHISAFSAGKLAPAVYGNWLGELAAAGIHPWAQDGAGTGRLPPLVRNAYLGALPCSVGVVHEAFRQTSREGQPFHAEPARPALASGCHPNAVFALRYLPQGKPLLDTVKDKHVQDH